MQATKHTEIIEIIQQKIDLSNYNNSFIDNIIAQRMKELKLHDVATYIDTISNAESEIIEIQSLLTNSFTQFFRNRFTFETLRHVFIPRFALQNNDGDELRVWSAGCAGGQEPYSLAMLFESFNEISAKEFKYRIFATDINYNEMERAAVGIYPKAELQNLTFFELDKWFERSGKKYTILPKIKKNVQFELFDLFDKECNCPRTSIFGSFDIIMLANVLIYYTEDTQKRILTNIANCTSKRGIVITGETEREIFLRNGFIEMYDHSCIFRK